MENNEVRYLYLDDIIPNRFQPRENFNEQALKELAVSIKEHGVIQPIIVRQIGEKYEIIAGERRYKASIMAGLTKIPAIIKNLDDKESSKVALIENLQRKDLTPIEEARTYQKILELDALTQEELAKTMGKSQSAVSNKLRLLSLTEEVQDALLHEQISERHARSLLTVTNPKQQVELLNKVIASRMTVRELDEEIKMINGDANINNNVSANNIPLGVENNAGIAQPNNMIFGDNQPPLQPQGLPSNVPEAAHIPNITNPTSVDIDKLRNESVDIIQPQQTADIDSLLRPSTTVITPSPVEQTPSVTSNNLFISDPITQPKDELIGGNNLFEPAPLNSPNISSEQPSPVVENNNIEPPVSNDNNINHNLFQNLGSQETPPISNIAPDVPNINVGLMPSVPTTESSSIDDPKATIDSVKQTIQEIKNSGKRVEVEEFDFDEFYQFVIRVDKN